MKSEKQWRFGCMSNYFEIVITFFPSMTSCFSSALRNNRTMNMTRTTTRAHTHTRQRAHTHTTMRTHTHTRSFVAKVRWKLADELRGVGDSCSSWSVLVTDRSFQHKTSKTHSWQPSYQRDQSQNMSEIPKIIHVTQLYRFKTVKKSVTEREQEGRWTKATISAASLPPPPPHQTKEQRSGTRTHTYTHARVRTHTHCDITCHHTCRQKSTALQNNDCQQRLTHTHTHKASIGASVIL